MQNWKPIFSSSVIVLVTKQETSDIETAYL